MRSIWLLFLLAPGLSAQIVTDRPDFVESSATVGVRAFQVETGIAEEHDGSVRVWSTPTLLRLGVASRVELRAESDLFMRQSFDGASDDGIADVALGVKWRTTEGGGAAPATAFLLHADLATGSRAWRGDGVRPSLRFVAEWELPYDMSLGMMPGVARSDGPNGVHTAGIYAITTGKDWSGTTHTFLELAFQHIAGDDDGGVLATFDAGGAWLVGETTQLDAAISLPVTSAAASSSFTLGFSHLVRP